jgi:hypothetical protein
MKTPRQNTSLPAAPKLSAYVTRAQLHAFVDRYPAIRGDWPQEMTGHLYRAYQHIRRLLVDNNPTIDWIKLEGGRAGWEALSEAVMWSVQKDVNANRPAQLSAFGQIITKTLSDDYEPARDANGDQEREAIHQAILSLKE